MSQFPSVTRFYDTHPINETQILRTLRTRGVALDTLTQEQLREHDQDHFGGLEANDALFVKAGMQRAHHVLDVCCGLGGPARDLAQKVGCRVTGLDLTESRYAAAIRLTRLVGLDRLVDFRRCDALAMPFPDATFDAVMGQEAWCHVPDKPKLIAECVRVLKPGGVIAFTDILRRDSLGSEEFEKICSGMAFPTLETFEGYQHLLQANNCAVKQCDDLGSLWSRILIDRLAMYRSLSTETENEFGRARSREWDLLYAFFVGLYSEGKLGGGRFIANKFYT